VYRKIFMWTISTVFECAAALRNQLPRFRPQKNGVRVESNIAYRSTGEAAHLLDVYRPVDVDGPLPIVLFIHGGGFRIFSKDSHRVLAMEFARHGAVVFCINYRLAPMHPYPAAARDVCEAYRWVVEHGHRFGGDPTRVAVAGESAGANLSTVIAIAACYRRPEPWARAVFDLGVVPRAVVPANGILQVSDPRRFQRSGASSLFTQPVIDACCANYICGNPSADIPTVTPHPKGHGLADPLCVLESTTPDRTLPPFYISCGTADPILDDTLRLGKSVRKHGSVAVVATFPKMGHSFHVSMLGRAAERCWSETHAFLAEHMTETE